MMFEMTTEKVFHADDKYVLRLLNVVIHEHQFKRKGKYYKFHFDKEACTKPEQPKTLDDLGCFDLKMFRKCPIRIEIITSSHIFILFLPRVVTLCLHFTPRGKIFGINANSW
jgi:hypothetical protein